MTGFIGKTYGKFEEISSKSTPILGDKYGYLCDVYFPTFGKEDSHGNFDEVNMFSTHKNPDYSNTPDLVGLKFYIPHLVKKQIMNSTSSEFETFYLDEESARPFIEVHPSEELPISSKVVVHFSETAIMNLFIEKKTMVPGGVFLRMYLNPLV